MGGFKDYAAFLSWFDKNEREKMFAVSVLPESEFKVARKFWL